MGIILDVVRVFTKGYKQTNKTKGLQDNSHFQPADTLIHTNTHLPLDTKLRDLLYWFLNLVLIKHIVFFS